MKESFWGQVIGTVIIVSIYSLLITWGWGKDALKPYSISTIGCYSALILYNIWKKKD